MVRRWTGESHHADCAVSARRLVQGVHGRPASLVGYRMTENLTEESLARAIEKIRAAGIQVFLSEEEAAEAARHFVNRMQINAGIRSDTRPAIGAAPCPFCASTDIHNWVSTDHGEKPAWSVMCFGCECEGPHVDNKADAIRLWNTRPA